MSRQFRALVFQLHGWLGLHIFLVLGMMFLTGTLLIFMLQIEALFDSDRHMHDTAGPASFGAQFDHARAVVPEGQYQAIHRSGSGFFADRSLLAGPDGEEYNLWHGGTGGQVTGQTHATDLHRVIFQLHSSFLAYNNLGGLFASALSVPLLLFIVTGLITYRRFWRGFFRAPPRHQGSRAFWGGAHRLLALWALPFLCVVGITGFYYFIGYLGVVPYRPVEITPPAPRAAQFPPGFDGTALDLAHDAAQNAMPGITFTLIEMPSWPGDGIHFYGADGTFLSGEEANVVVVDPTNLVVIGQRRVADMPVAARVSEAINMLHYGLWGGMVSEILWLIFGAMATGLSFAGAMIYASRTGGAEHSDHTAMSRIWQGMSILKWTLPLFAIVVIIIGVIRLG